MIYRKKRIQHDYSNKSKNPLYDNTKYLFIINETRKKIQLTPNDRGISSTKKAYSRHHN